MSGVLAELSKFAKVETVFVYISEAHAESEWPIATDPQYAVQHNHVTAEERWKCAARARDALPGLQMLRTFIDDMHDSFLRLYGAWPTQLLLFSGGLLMHRAKPDSAAFNVVEFYQQVQTLLGTNCHDTKM